MIKRQEVLNSESCFNKAAEDELMFTLLGRDASAPVAIRAWAAERVRRGKNQKDDPQIKEALEVANQIELLHPPKPDKEGWLCLHCGKVSEPDPRLQACPNCGATGSPVDLSEELNVRTTWHELRILVMWAERYASTVSFQAQAQGRDTKDGDEMLKVVYAIADRIQNQHLDQECGLTFASELADLRADPRVRGEVQQNVIHEIPSQELPDGPK